MRIVIATKPRSYREAIAGALRIIRPHLKVAIVEPGSFGTEVSRLAPELAIYSPPNELPCDNGCTWIELPEDTVVPATVCREGRRSEISGLDLKGLVAVIDETERALSGA